MKIITHDWNGSAIAQLTEDTKIAKYDVPASYVNLTQMCQANDKKLNNYMRMEGTKAYWEALSTETRISVSALVITIKGGNDKQAQGTWGHPEIAIDLAQWVSIPFRIWANRTLRKLMSGETSQPKPQIDSQITPEQLIGAYSIIIDKFSISEELKGTYLLRAMEAQYPGITPSVQKLLPTVQPKTEEEYISPTRLAQVWNERHSTNIKAYQINQALEETGYQTSYYTERTSSKTGKIKRTKQYSPTDLGSEYSTFLLDKAGTDKTVQVLRWKVSIIEEIKNQLGGVN
ncbi:MAG: KilA-N domain-containing protein [Cyanobacteria bacterium P01_A01_bin.68]